jgi:hypothetical protein
MGKSSGMAIQHHYAYPKVHWNPWSTRRLAAGAPLAPTTRPPQRELVLASLLRCPPNPPTGR